MKELEVSLGRQLKLDPTWSDVLDILSKLKGNLGQFELGWYEVLKSGGKESLTGIVVEGGDGFYRPEFYFDTENGLEIRAYKNPKADDSWVELGAYEYPLEVVTDDFGLIVKMVKEFYETGTVKELNHIYDYTKTDRV